MRGTTGDREVEGARREHAREEREQCEAMFVTKSSRGAAVGYGRHHHHDADDRGGDCDLSDAVVFTLLRSVSCAPSVAASSTS